MREKKIKKSAEALLTAGQRRLKAEGAGRAAGINIAEEGISAPMQDHPSPTVYSSSSEA